MTYLRSARMDIWGVRQTRWEVQRRGGHGRRSDCVDTYARPIDCAGRESGVLLQQRMIFRQLFGVPDGQFMAQRFFGNLILRQGLDDFVVDQQTVDIQQFFAGGIR